MHVVRWCDARTYEGMFDALFLLQKYERGLAYCTSLDSPTFQKLRPHPPSHECSYPFISCVFSKNLTTAKGMVRFDVFCTSCSWLQSGNRLIAPLFSS